MKFSWTLSGKAGTHSGNGFMMGILNGMPRLLNQFGLHGFVGDMLQSVHRVMLALGVEPHFAAQVGFPEAMRPDEAAGNASAFLCQSDSL
jgi:hypothetical protein